MTSLPPPLVTAGEVAERFAVSEDTVWRWARDGRFPSVRLPGGTVRFRVADVVDAIEGRQSAGDAA